MKNQKVVVDRLTEIEGTLNAYGQGWIEPYDPEHVQALQRERREIGNELGLDN